MQKSADLDEFSKSDLSNARDFSDGQSVHKTADLGGGGGNDALPVGFVHIRADFGQHAVGSHSTAAGQPGLSMNPVPHLCSHLCSCAKLRVLKHLKLCLPYK